MPRYLRAKHPALLLLFIALFSWQVTDAASAATNATVKYVRLEIGHGGLHCPFLGPRLEQSYKAVSGIQNFKLFTRESYATFELTGQPEVSEAQLRDIAVKVGYPVTDVTVIISETQPGN